MLEGFHSLSRGRIVVPFVNPNTTETEVFENKQAIWNFQRLQTHRSVSYERRSRSETIGQTQRTFTADGVQSQTNRRSGNRVFNFMAKIFTIGQDHIAALISQFVD